MIMCLTSNVNVINGIRLIKETRKKCIFMCVLKLRKSKEHWNCQNVEPDNCQAKPKTDPKKDRNVFSFYNLHTVTIKKCIQSVREKCEVIEPIHLCKLLKRWCSLVNIKYPISCVIVNTSLHTLIFQYVCMKGCNQAQN